jgi:hypothetical protein
MLIAYKMFVASKAPKERHAHGPKNVHIPILRRYAKPLCPILNLPVDKTWMQIKSKKMTSLQIMLSSIKAPAGRHLNRKTAPAINTSSGGATS